MRRQPTAAELRLLEQLDESEVVELLRDLIQCRSDNPPGQELACAEAIQRYLSANGISGRLVEALPGRPNAIAYVEFGSGPTLALNGHMDTVPPGSGWTTDPFGGALQGDLVFGRGAMDMKGGLAAACVTVAVLKRSGLPLHGRLALHAVIDEEVGGTGSKQSSLEDADWVIIAEPTNGQVFSHGNGQLNWEVVVSGTAAHMAAPEEGRNAIHDAAALTALLEAHNRELAKAPFPGIGPATYAVAVIAGGLSGSTVPNQCTMTIDRHVSPSETLDQAEDEFQGLLDQLAARRPGFQSKFVRTLEFPPLSGSNSAPLAETIRNVVRDLGGPETDNNGMRFATDAAWYAARRRSVVVFGPGDGSTSHEPDERIRVDDLLFGAKALVLTAVRLLG